MKIIYSIITFLMLSVSLFSQDLMHTTEFYWADKFVDRSVELWGTLEVNSPIFNDFLALAPDDRIVLNRRGCEFHTDGSEEFTGLPYWVTLRAELREEPLSTVPTGFTHVYEYIWDVDLLPYLTGPVAIFQRFHDVYDRPDIHMELAGEGQFPDAPNGTVLIHGFDNGWTRTQKALKPRNHLLVAIYSESSGHYKISLNGETLLEKDAYTIADTLSYSGQQFGIYNHSGTMPRIQFTHIWYRCRQYNGRADFSQLESTDPNDSTATSLQVESSPPEDFVLQQNYPNPFNPVTNINYTLPIVETGPRKRDLRHAPSLHNVRLVVYDMLGNEIGTLVNEQKQAGTYDVKFDAEKLPSGIYLYSLISGNYSETKKMVLLR